MMITGHDFQEWTEIAFRILCDHKHLGFLDIPTVTYNDTLGFLSKGITHQLEALRLLDEIKNTPNLRLDIVATIHTKRNQLTHDLATMH